jgi:prophage DNA circulation protein
MNTRALTLQPVVNLTYNATLPSLLLAQMIYGDATREPDLTARNDAANTGGHPGFMPLTIEALAQ